MVSISIVYPPCSRTSLTRSLRPRLLTPSSWHNGGSTEEGRSALSRPNRTKRYVYYGAIYIVLFTIAILLVRIQLLSLAPHGMLSTRADYLLLSFAPRTPRLVPFNYQLRAYCLINRRQLVAVAYFTSLSPNKKVTRYLARGSGLGGDHVVTKPRDHFTEKTPCKDMCGQC